MCIAAVHERERETQARPDCEYIWRCLSRRTRFCRSRRESPAEQTTSSPHRRANPDPERKYHGHRLRARQRCARVPRGVGLRCGAYSYPIVANPVPSWIVGGGLARFGVMDGPLRDPLGYRRARRVSQWMREVTSGYSRHGRNVKGGFPMGQATLILWAAMPPFSGMRCLVVGDEPRLRPRCSVRPARGRRLRVRRSRAPGSRRCRAGEGRGAAVISELADARNGRRHAACVRSSRAAGDAVIVGRPWPSGERRACLQMGALDYVAKRFSSRRSAGPRVAGARQTPLIIENRNYSRVSKERVEAQAPRIEELFLEGVMRSSSRSKRKTRTRAALDLRVGHYSSRSRALSTWIKDLIRPPFRARRRSSMTLARLAISESVCTSGQLSDAEYRHIMEHTVIGARILGPLMRDAPGALAIVRSHHERLDGTGPPTA